jgi:low temperature requirement protein LtrA
VSRQIRIRMSARPTDEPHRVASQLELLSDLTFVIAIAILTGHFAHAVAAGHALEELVPFLQVFFAIWWAWGNFTWFGSSFDTDDVPFRLLTIVQMAGVLILAAGVPAAFEHGDLTAVTFGYVIIRVGLVAHWLRAAIENPSSRGTALRYAIGITLATVGWVLRLGLHEAGVLSNAALLGIYAALVILELGVPLWSGRTGRTSWHPHHIAERYGLFAIILLGDSVFVASAGVERVLAAGGVSAPLAAVAVSALALLFALWWRAPSARHPGAAVHAPMQSRSHDGMCSALSRCSRRGLMGDSLYFWRGSSVRATRS